jgi:hypothetical protein
MLMEWSTVRRFIARYARRRRGEHYPRSARCCASGTVVHWCALARIKGEGGRNRLADEHAWSRGRPQPGQTGERGTAWWSSHGDPGVQTITGVSGFGASAPRVLQRTAELIPDQLKFSATPDATPARPVPDDPVGARSSRHQILVRRATGAGRLWAVRGMTSPAGRPTRLGWKRSRGGCAAGTAPVSGGTVSAGIGDDGVHRRSAPLRFCVSDP